MESLADVAAILRFNDRSDLASLLNHAHVDSELIDIGESLSGDMEVVFVSVLVYAPMPNCEKLRSLPRDDNNQICEAIEEVWSYGGRSHVSVQNISYRVDINSLRDAPMSLFTSPSGWELVDRTMGKIRGQLATASVEEDFQQVGHLCREALISLAQAVFDPERHPPLGSDDANHSSADVKRMMDRYLAAECSGPHNKEFRKCVRSAFDLANIAQHDWRSTYRDAAFCAQATLNTVALVEVMSGKRDRVVDQERS